MRRLPAVLFRTVQRRQHFQPLPRLRQSAQDICLKGYRSLAYIMDPAQKPGMREQRFLALKAHGPFCTFREPLPDQPLHDARRIPQVHPERQPQAGILRVRFTSQKPCFIQRPAHFCSFSGVCAFRVPSIADNVYYNPYFLHFISANEKSGTPGRASSKRKCPCKVKKTAIYGPVPPSVPKIRFCPSAVNGSAPIHQSYKKRFLFCIKSRPGFHCGNRGGSFCLLVFFQTLNTYQLTFSF